MLQEITTILISILSHRHSGTTLRDRFSDKFLKHFRVTNTLLVLKNKEVFSMFPPET